MFDQSSAVKIAERITKIYRRVRSLQQERSSPGAPIRIVPIEEIMARPLHSRLDAVDNDVSGLEYAVWCIGETLMLIGGRDAMDQVFDLAEAMEEGTRLASWLDHRWDGVTNGDDIWVA